jgi:hypothetical protein
MNANPMNKKSIVVEKQISRRSSLKNVQRHTFAILDLFDRQSNTTNVQEIRKSIMPSIMYMLSFSSLTS